MNEWIYEWMQLKIPWKKMFSNQEKEYPSD